MARHQLFVVVVLVSVELRHDVPDKKTKVRHWQCEQLGL
jgi:hypothetical protein